MASTKTKFFVGLFVLVGFVLITVLIVWVGMSHYFESGQYYAAYFDESVQGLSKDSPVKYRGVSIGRVSEIRVAPDATLIETIVKIETDMKPQKDMVAQLKSVGITGIMFIELDRRDKDEKDQSPRIKFEPPYPVISTKPSDIKTFLTSVSDVLDQLRAFEMAEISEKVKRGLDSFTQVLQDAQIKTLSLKINELLTETEKILTDSKWKEVLVDLKKAGGSIHSTAQTAEAAISDIRETVGRLDGILADNERGIENSILHVNQAAKNAENMMQKGTQLMSHAENSVAQIRHQLLITLRELENTIENLDGLVDRISDQPSRLLFGAPPEERKINP